MDENLILVEEYYIVNLGASVNPLWVGLENIIDGLEHLQCKLESILNQCLVFVEEDDTC